MQNKKKDRLILIILYSALFICGIRTLFHGFPDIERFFAEWMDERATLTYIMKFGTLNFAPSEIFHPPLYHYLTFIPIAIFFAIGKLMGFFHDKIEFISFYFNNTHYFFLIGRVMSYAFYWLSALMIFKIVRLFYNKKVSHTTTFSYLLIPRFIFDFSTTRPETLLFLTTALFFYFFLKYYLNTTKVRYLLLSAFFVGVSSAVKYNAIFLSSIFMPILIFNLRHKDIKFKCLLSLGIKIGFFIFLGFFICNPFFVIQFKKYFHSLLLLLEEVKLYWKGYHTLLFLTHIKNVSSTLYLNVFGFFILLLGALSLLRKERKLFILLFFAILVFEVYFWINLKDYSPLYYLNPLVPIAAFIFSVGVNYVMVDRKKLGPILIIFGIILSYNYFNIVSGLSQGSTHLQKATAFIEKTVPEFTAICVTSDNHLPQLNMTKGSYYRLIKTARSIARNRAEYRDMDNEEDYGDIFKRLRLQSLTKKPQYHLIRWDDGIRTEEDAKSFLKKNNIEYIVSRGPHSVANRDLEDTGIAFLVKGFKPNNRRIYDAIGGASVGVYLYKVN